MVHIGFSESKRTFKRLEKPTSEKIQIEMFIVAYPEVWRDFRNWLNEIENNVRLP